MSWVMATWPRLFGRACPCQASLRQPSWTVDLLVDGGIMANLPIDVMREMNVDIIIAVDVEFPLYSAEDLDSVFAISEQMLTVLMRRETLRQIELLEEQDILIRPELGLHGSADFATIMETVEPGEQGCA